MTLEIHELPLTFCPHTQHGKYFHWVWQNYSSVDTYMVHNISKSCLYLLCIALYEDTLHMFNKLRIEHTFSWYIIITVHFIEGLMCLHKISLYTSCFKSIKTSWFGSSVWLQGWCILSYKNFLKNGINSGHLSGSVG